MENQITATDGLGNVHKYTPGPWTVTPFYPKQTGPADEWQIGTTTSIIATIKSRKSMPDEANARLIAAAPSLAKALRQAVDVLDRSYRHGKLIDLNNGLLRKAIDDARSALADIDEVKE